MRPTHVSVLIPARNEEALLPACLQSVKRAVKELRGATADIVVVADSSTDRTWEIANRELAGFGTVVETQAGIVGETRALAAAIALERFRGRTHDCWFSNTDADCVVPDDWLTVQVTLAAQGIDAIAGTIDVLDFREHHPTVKERFRQTYLIGSDGFHAHVHGANLGIRADLYLRAGGWRDLATGEDHDLWARLRQVNARSISVNRARVVTSGRKVGRAPHGFADALAAHNRTVNDPE